MPVCTSVGAGVWWGPTQLSCDRLVASVCFTGRCRHICCAAIFYTPSTVYLSFINPNGSRFIEPKDNNGWQGRRRHSCKEARCKEPHHGARACFNGTNDAAPCVHGQRQRRGGGFSIDACFVAHHLFCVAGCAGGACSSSSSSNNTPTRR